MHTGSCGIVLPTQEQLLCILNEDNLHILYLLTFHKPPVVCTLVFLPLVCQIDHVVQNHPAYDQVQALARQR